MARPSKLSPEQWAEVEQRAAEGESARSIAKAFGVDEAAIRRRVSPHTPRIKETAQKIVEARTALAELPVAHQYVALSLADKLRNVSMSFASAAELGAKTAHRFHALANAEAQKVDDANPLSPESMEALRGIAVLTKVANDSLVPATSLLSAHKDAAQKAATPPADEQSAPPVRERLPLDAWKKAHGLA